MNRPSRDEEASRPVVRVVMFGLLLLLPRPSHGEATRVAAPKAPGKDGAALAEHWRPSPVVAQDLRFLPPRERLLMMPTPLARRRWTWLWWTLGGVGAAAATAVGVVLGARAYNDRYGSPYPGLDIRKPSFPKAVTLLTW